MKNDEKKFVSNYTLMENGWAAVAFQDDDLIYDDLDFMDVSNNFRSIADIGQVFSPVSIDKELRQQSKTGYKKESNSHSNEMDDTFTSSNPNGNL